MSSSYQSQAPVQSNPRDIQKRAKTLTDDIGELLELYYKLAVVTATEKAANAASVSISIFIILFFSMFTLLFAGIALAWYLGEVFDNMIAGFLVVALLFMLLIAVTLILRKSFLFPLIRNTIIKKVYE